MTDLPYRPCVGIMLVNTAGLVFVGQRKGAPGPAWQMPQGGIDPGESPQDAALRELEEETGLAPALVRIEAEAPDWISYDLPADFQRKAWGGKYRGQTQRWFLMRFLGSDADITLDVPHPEFSEWKWSPADDVLSQIVDFKREAYAAVFDAFRPHLA